MARLSQVALAGSQGISLFSYSQASDPPLILAASAPVASSAVVWYTSGSHFLSISTDSLHVSVWKSTGQKLYDVQRTDSDSSLPIAAAVFHEKGVALAAGGSVHLYSSAGTFTKSLGGHPLGASLSCLAANADDSLLASAAGSSLIIFNRTTNTQNTLHAKGARAQAYSVLAFAPSRRTFLAAATSNGLVHLFDTSKPSAPLRTISLSSSPLPPAVSNLAFSTFAPLLLVSSSTGHLSLVDTEKQKVIVQFELGAAVEKGKMALAQDGRTAAFVGKGLVRMLDIKTRKGCKEVKIEGGGRLGSIAFQPTPSKSGTAGPPSPTKPTSSILTESINRMRASQRAASPDKEQAAPKNKMLAAPQLEGINEVFSPLQFGGARTNQLDLAPQDLPSSKDAFAASIAREARTSTLRNPTLQQSHTPADRLAHSSVSYASPDLPSYSHSPENIPPIARRSASTSTTTSSHSSSRSSSRQSTASRPPDAPSLSHRPSLTSLRAASPALSAANTTTRSSRSANDTIGALTKGLRLPELEDEMDLREERRREKAKEKERATVEEEGENATPVPKKKSAKAGREKEKERRVGFAAPQPVAAPSGVKDPGPAPKRSEPPREVAMRRKAPLDEEFSEELAVAERRVEGGGDLLKSAVREVMEEMQAKTSRDVQNLHLELMRGTFTQKTEMKSLMKQHLGAELQQLREENARLREENARLKRGY